MVAKVIPPTGEIFYVKNRREIVNSEGFDRLNPALRELLDRIGIFGTEDGIHIVNFDGDHPGASITLTKQAVGFKGSSEGTWTDMMFQRKPFAVVFTIDGTRLEPMTTKEMEAELAIRQKPSRVEK